MINIIIHQPIHRFNRPTVAPVIVLALFILQEENWCIPRPYHYKLPGCSHYVTILYPEIDSHGQGIDEKILGKYRML